MLVWSLHTLVNEDGIINTEVQSILNEFDNTKIIVTNSNDAEIEKLGLNNLNYEIFTLAHEPNKVNPLYFDILLRTYNLLPKNTIYFDSSEEALSAAKSMWITTYKFDKNKDINVLRNYLKVNLFHYVNFFWTMCALEVYWFIDVMPYW